MHFCHIQKLGVAFVSAFIFAALPLAPLSLSPALAQLEMMGSLREEQEKEKQELDSMKQEMNEIKSTINDANSQMNQLRETMSQQGKIHEMHLFAREAMCEIVSGVKVNCMTYNGRLPGPPIRVQEGEIVRIVLHNQLKVPTSLHLHGLIAPHNVDGLPKKDQGLVKPGESYAYQFQAMQPGTYWYHPQVIHQDQKLNGMYGALIVDPKLVSKQVDKDIVFLLGSIRAPSVVKSVTSSTVPAGSPGAGTGAGASGGASAAASSALPTYYIVNGQSAPSIPPLELKRGERVRLRVINAGQEAVPLHLTGHRFSVSGINGGDPLEPHVLRDTISVGPSERVDLEFVADNPGVWSLASELMHQATTNGKFPGGIACVVRYDSF